MWFIADELCCRPGRGRLGRSIEECEASISGHYNDEHLDSGAEGSSSLENNRGTFEVTILLDGWRLISKPGFEITCYGYYVLLTGLMRVVLQTILTWNSFLHGCFCSKNQIF